MHVVRVLKNGTCVRLGVWIRRVVAPSMRGSKSDQIGASNRGIVPAFRVSVETAHNADDFQDFTDVFSSETASPIAR